MAQQSCWLFRSKCHCSSVRFGVWLVEALGAESSCGGDGELAAELGGVLLGAAHEVLEGGIFASLEVAIVVQVHSLEDVVNIGHAALVVLDVSDDGADAVVVASVDIEIALWGVIEWLETVVEDHTTKRNSSGNKVVVEVLDEMHDKHVLLKSIALWVSGIAGAIATSAAVVFSASFIVSSVIGIEPGDQLI